ncbi:hypothetical protein [Aureliella helgolandensis]|uniref:HEAT repeat domain-containing protein n=1 Tax=Aureliella helgolandensis TaxID=2527968 RepID=A0A518G5J6_9BACT|nr:hypothetical protein [Aureliella helgolandensis]QDV23871.1 hypothetical protein Q31a_21800 [Aureliella helgolandensis]
MIKIPFSDWRKELLKNSKLVQDDDDTTPTEEAERRFNRYIQLVDMVNGKEAQEVFQALVDSIRVPEDYGAFEAVHRALWKFSPDDFADYFVAALPKLIRRMAKHDQVVRFLIPLTGHARRKYLPAFHAALDRASPGDRRTILNFVKRNSEELGDVLPL